MLGWILQVHFGPPIMHCTRGMMRGGVNKYQEGVRLLLFMYICVWSFNYRLKGLLNEAVQQHRRCI